MNTPPKPWMKPARAAAAIGLSCAVLAWVAPRIASARTALVQASLGRLSDVAEETMPGTDAVPMMGIGTPYFLAGLWYEVTDEFEEKCGLSTLRIETGSNNHFTSITRGDPDYVTPYSDPNDVYGGDFDWKCGSNLEHSSCSDSPNGADHIRVYWSKTGRNIAIKCFEKCGDGSSQSDCY
ncbi:MAG: hypothetical protein IAG13_15145 [Deltaproteobacteria bacterium]|nr:hypothetical protein [Nannocystaceae bacterium]